MDRRTRYSPEVRERAVRMVFDHEGEYSSQWSAMVSISQKFGCTTEEKKRYQRLLKTGFVDLHRLVNPPLDQGLNYGFNPRKPPTSRLQLILGSDSVANSVDAFWVDLKYRAFINASVGKTWPASAPVVVDLG